MAESQGWQTLRRALETVESETKPKKVWKGRLTEEEHFALDQQIRCALAEHARIDELMQQTGLSKAAVYRHLGHVRKEFQEWVGAQKKDAFLTLLMASVGSLENQARDLTAAKKEAKTINERVKLALAIKEIELAIVKQIGDGPEFCGLWRRASILNPDKVMSYADQVSRALIDS